MSDAIEQFQSTPPARGATLLSGCAGGKAKLFQSTPPARGATSPFSIGLPPNYVSIHAPRTGGDESSVKVTT